MLHCIPFHYFVVKLLSFQLHSFDWFLFTCVNNHHHLKDGLIKETTQERGGLAQLLFAHHRPATRPVQKAVIQSLC